MVALLMDARRFFSLHQFLDPRPYVRLTPAWDTRKTKILGDFSWPGSRIPSCMNGATGLPPFPGELDKAAEERFLRQAGGLPHLRVHRDGRESGEGVDLVDVEGTVPA